MASSRAKRILQLALERNEQNVRHPSNNNTIGNNSFTEALSPIVEALSPQEIVEIINTAEVVFKCNDADFEYYPDNVENELSHNNNNENNIKEMRCETKCDNMIVNRTNNCDNICKKISFDIVIEEDKENKDGEVTKKINNRDNTLALEKISFSIVGEKDGKNKEIEITNKTNNCDNTLEKINFDIAVDEHKEKEDNSSSYSPKSSDSEYDVGIDTNVEEYIEKVNNGSQIQKEDNGSSYYPETSDSEYDEDIDSNSEEHIEEVNNGSGIQNYDSSSNEIQNEDGNEQCSLDNKKRKVKGENKRIINKKLRMSGQRYLGFRKPLGEKNTFHDTQRPQRKLKARCNCKKKAKDPTKKCFLVSNKAREDIFTKFWQDMTWDQRKVYVSNSTTIKNTERPKSLDHTSRRNFTINYNLNVANESIPVCKKMYLHTLGLGEWSVRTWALQSKNGMNESFEKRISQRENRKDSFYEDKKFLKDFLENLNKLPSHYCRKNTGRLYVEQIFQSSAELHRSYKKICEENGKMPLSITCLTKLMDDMKISIFRPRKDQCDVCFKFKNQNLTDNEYKIHIAKKESARKEKEKDKKNALEGRCHVITMDVQAVKLSPQLPASSLYYKTKLCCHNFTVYNLANRQATCYWYDETNADGQASTYASFLVNYLEEHFLNSTDKLPIIVYSDGCTAQNRNSIMANSLLYLSDKYNVCITQKFLEKGHTQMECDSVHSAIEIALKNKEIYLPSDYIQITKLARPKNPYVARKADYTFFRHFGVKNFLKYSSIKPTRTAGVTDIRILKYCDGKIMFKLNFVDDDYQDLPTRPKIVNFVETEFPPLFRNRLPISKIKYEHLQIIKSTIPQDCWSYYDLLPYKKD